jgi:hypothetical protein
MPGTQDQKVRVTLPLLAVAGELLPLLLQAASARRRHVPLPPELTRLRRTQSGAMGSAVIWERSQTLGCRL